MLPEKMPVSEEPAVSSELEDTYARRFDSLRERRKEVWNVLCRHFFRKWIPPSATVLDLGAGYCEFVNAIEAAQRFALDLNPATARQAAAGVKVLSQDIAETWDIVPSSIDVLFTSNFLEHLQSKAKHCWRIACGKRCGFCGREGGSSRWGQISDSRTMCIGISWTIICR